jgi:hypothetical protein
MLGNTCSVVRKDGQSCLGTPGRSGLCWAHDPATAEARQEARRKGGQGKARAAKLLPRDLEVLDAVLAQAIAGVYQGSLSPSQGSALAALASALVRLREVALRLAEQGELRDRLLCLEEKLNEIDIKGNRNGKGTGYVRG